MNPLIQIVLWVIASIISMLGLVVALGLWNQSRLTKRKTAHFLDRQALNYTELLRDGFPGITLPEDELVTIWQLLGSAVCIDCRYLRPEDRLDDHRIISDLDAKYDMDTKGAVRDLIADHRIVFHDLEMTSIRPQTLRDVVYLCIGRDELVKE